MNESKENSITVGFLDIIHFVKKYVFRIVSIGLITGLIGYLYASTQTEEYISRVDILPEMQSKNSLGGFRALADLAGINLDNMQVAEAIRPDLYPSVLESKPFLLNVLQLKVYTSTDTTKYIIKDFLQLKAKKEKSIGSILSKISFKKRENNTIKINNQVAKSLPSDIILIDKELEELVNNVNERIQAELDRKTGVITVKVKMPDPLVAAWIAQYSVDYLKEYMLEYRSGKEAEQMKFYKGQMDKAEKRFREASRTVREFRDKTRNPFFTASASQEDQLQAEVTVSQNLYSEVSKQYEQAKLKMQSETPVLKVLDPPQVPLVRSSPKKVFSFLIGFMIGVIGCTFGLLIAKLLK
ncbi:lipopolysaccharide biosynthesis protein [Siphonobacter sp. BAB-5385]|uniref:hypothetical protein n=1 Tax=Siphonobacter sp. BAB-5385 TaxID=1864822 RepID=UPI000B9DFA58|nr:hypothetical protein [Siphonobacter sp. BAB-5385]OZI07543.1 lipopolysaccharide biosynthesis protein [Siphonobacter sp. BAB-5385]